MTIIILSLFCYDYDMEPYRIRAAWVCLFAAVVMAAGMVSPAFSSELPVSCGFDAAGLTTWYFAEGYTGAGFEEYLTLQNAGMGEARVEVTYFQGGGATSNRTHYVPGGSRYTIFVNSDAGEDLELAVLINSDLPIVAERPMYFHYQGRVNGGHVGRGAGTTAPDWYFAEGYTGPGFDEYLTLLNPNAFNCVVDVVYMIRGSGEVTRTHEVPAASRYTVNVKADAGERLELSARVGSFQEDHVTPAGIVAERSIYFLFGGTIDGGSVSLGSTELGTSWYFAEGYTGDYFQEYLTIMNPQDTEARVEMTYFTDSGDPTVRPELAVPAHGRETVLVNTDVGAGRNVSARVDSDIPILVERPIYFSFFCGELQALGGDVAMGSLPVLAWCAAEGYTGPVFYEFLTVLNPNDEAVTISVKYFLKGEPVQSREYDIKASSRYTILVNDEIGRDKECGLEVAVVTAGGLPALPVVVERPMYFLYQGAYSGGHISIGYPQ